jgi:RNase P/RNase MRP subunit POP5
MNAADLEEQITSTRAILSNLTSAILALADPTVESYSFDTGQTVTRVTRAKLPEFIATQRSLQNSLAMLCARQTGSNVLMAAPVGPRGGRRNW